MCWHLFTPASYLVPRLVLMPSPLPRLSPPPLLLSTHSTHPMTMPCRQMLLALPVVTFRTLHLVPQMRPSLAPPSMRSCTAPCLAAQLLTMVVGAMSTLLGLTAILHRMLPPPMTHLALLEPLSQDEGQRLSGPSSPSSMEAVSLSLSDHGSSVVVLLPCARTAMFLMVFPQSESSDLLPSGPRLAAPSPWLLLTSTAGALLPTSSRHPLAPPPLQSSLVVPRGPFRSGLPVAQVWSSSLIPFVPHWMSTQIGLTFRLIFETPSTQSTVVLSCLSLLSVSLGFGDGSTQVMGHPLSFTSDAMLAHLRSSSLAAGLAREIP